MKYIKFIVILFIALIIMGFTAPSQSYIDWSEGGNFRWGVFDGFYPYSDSTYIGVDTVPVWKIYVKNGYIDSLYAIEYIDTIYKIHKIEEIDTIFKVHIDSIEGRINQIGLGQSTYLGLNAGLNDDLTNNANTGIGYQALYDNTTGYDNVGVGYQSLYNNISGYTNVAIGVEALFFNTSGYANVVIGYEGMNSNTTGNDNTAIGVGALYSNTTGTHNASIGYGALYTNTAGSSNTAIGINAGKFITGVFSNEIAYQSTYIGANTKAYAAGDTNEIVIGANAIGAGDNTVTIGHTDIIKTVLRGKVEADSIKSDSIETNELLVKNNAMVEDTTKLKYLKWYNNDNKAIYCLSVFQWSLGHLSANSDSVIVGGDTTTRWNAGAMIYETNKNELLIYDGNEWEANAEVYVNGLDTVAVGSVNTWTTAKLWTAGLSGGALIVGDSVIVVKSKGVYDVDGHLNCSSETVNHTFQWGVSVNSAVPAVKTRGIEKFTNTDWGSLATGCRLDLSIDDTLRFQVMDTLSGSPCDLYVLYGNIGIEKR